MTAIMLRELIDRCSGRLPADVEARARWLVLDTLGCAIAGSRSPVVGNWLDAQRLRDDPYGTCLDGARPTGAAMALAMGACWDEACEGHARAHGRPGVAALAALWPRVSELDLDHLLRALVIGYEVGARMGALLRIGLGMHVDGNWPALGAAAAAASGLGLDQAGIVTAINIAACQLPTSLYRPIETGDTARNTYLGHGAMLGEMAAQAAAVGIGAPDDAVESYARVAYGRSLDGETADSTTYEILDGYFKPYAAARHVHYAAEAALQLRDRTTPESVRRIELWTYEEATVYCGIRAPRTPLQAQFSLSFGVAAMLRWGCLGPSVYRGREFVDSLLRALEDRVVVRVDPDWTGSGTRAARLRLGLSDGRTLEEVVLAVKGDRWLPWSEADLVEKFIGYSREVLGEERATRLAEHILHAPGEAGVFP